MKALVYTGAKRLEHRDVPEPTPAAGELLVRIDSVGICGSDMHAFLGHDERRPPPLILGHEVAGTVTGGKRDGERVTVNPLVVCGECPACASGRDNLCGRRQLISMPPREGGFAEMVAMPERNLVAVPENVSLEVAALAEPVACGWHAVRLARDHLKTHQDAVQALVLGGGAIGLGSALCLAASGIEDVTIVEPNAARRAYLERECAQVAVEPDTLESAQDFDLVIDAVGYEKTREMACERVRPGGLMVHIGLGSARGGLDVRRMTLQEIGFFGTYAYTAQDFRDTAQAIFDGKLGKLGWTEKRPLGDGQAAFDDIGGAKVAAPKILLKPN